MDPPYEHSTNRGNPRGQGPSGRNQGRFPLPDVIPTAAVQSRYFVAWLARWGFFGAIGGPECQRRQPLSTFSGHRHMSKSHELNAPAVRQRIPDLGPRH